MQVNLDLPPLEEPNWMEGDGYVPPNPPKDEKKKGDDGYVPPDPPKDKKMKKPKDEKKKD